MKGTYKILKLVKLFIICGFFLFFVHAFSVGLMATYYKFTEYRGNAISVIYTGDNPPMRIYRDPLSYPELFMTLYPKLCTESVDYGECDSQGIILIFSDVVFVVLFAWIAVKIKRKKQEAESSVTSKE